MHVQSVSISNYEIDLAYGGDSTTNLIQAHQYEKQELRRIINP